MILLFYVINKRKLDYIRFLSRVLGVIFICHCGSAKANCSAEYFNLSAVLAENTGGDPIADQMRRARLAQAQSAVGACNAAERREKAERARLAEEERRRLERVRIEQESASIERARVDQLATERAAAAQEAEAARLADQDLRTRVSQAVLEGRCEDAKTIALLASRIDMAEQALRICKPQATKSPSAAGRVAATQGRTPPATPKASAITAVQPKQTPASPAPNRALQPTSVGSPPSQSPMVPDFPTQMMLAEQGDADAQTNIGFIYGAGRGVMQDYVAAFRWFYRAAVQGHAKGQNALGTMYASAQGVPQDYNSALYWYREAADQGDAEAQYNLGVMYRDGKGVKQNSVAAYKWFGLAAGTGNASAKRQRDTLAATMSTAQVAEAQRLASLWRKK